MNIFEQELRARALMEAALKKIFSDHTDAMIVQDEVHIYIPQNKLS